MGGAVSIGDEKRTRVNHVDIKNGWIYSIQWVNLREEFLL